MEERNASVEIRKNAILPTTFADTVRKMKVQEYIVVAETLRVARYNQATSALPGAKFTTRKIQDGIVHLIRTA
jgi:hypothetical protein